MKCVLFRADSSSQIGTGHIMRDLVLAEQFAKEGIKVVFAVRDLEGNITSKIPYNVVTLSTGSKEELVKFVQKLKIDLLIIDHYEIDYAYEKYLKEQTGVKIFVFDATYRKHYCDYLLNQNIYANKNCYKSLVPSFCKVFCGLEYALIREEFKAERLYKMTFKKEYKEQKKRILITLGGADPNNDTLRILKELENYAHNSLDIVVVLGRANSHFATIQTFATVSKHTIILKQDIRNMAVLMRGIDCAIVSAGTTAIELLYLQIPFFVVSIAKNQELAFKYLVENGLAYDFTTCFNEKKLSSCKPHRFLNIGTKNVVSEVDL